MDATLATDSYLSRFEQIEGSRRVPDPAWLSVFRRSAMDRFVNEGFPTTRNERWQKTNVAPIERTVFRLPDGREGIDPDTAERAAQALGRIPPGLGSTCRLVFVGARFAPELSSSNPLPEGVRVANLADTLRAEPGLIEGYLGRTVRPEDHPFAALNSAFFDEGAFIFLPEGAVLTEPVQVVFIQAGGPSPIAVHPRTLVVAGARSRATIVESYLGAGPGIYLTNAVTELALGEGAAIEHYKVQTETLEAFHVAVSQARLGRDSTLTSHSVSIGGALVRNDLGALLDAEGAECTLNGLFLAGDGQHVDNHTTIDHAKPRCTSRELYKGVLDGRSRGVFDGRIIVRQDAQQTDARQTNRNLLLSEAALIDTKPQLEILNDDVKCAHAATIGRLDENALFYLRARGIDGRAARNMLMKAFAIDVFSAVRIAPLRAGLEALVTGWLERKGRSEVAG